MPDLAGTAGTIHYASWIPTSPRVLAVFNHGLGEHVGLYSPFAEALNDAGIALWAHDHFGHGLSAGTRVLVDNIDHFLDDSLMVLEHARAAHPSLPLVLIGHSLGATLATLLVGSARCPLRRWSWRDRPWSRYPALSAPWWRCSPRVSIHSTSARIQPRWSATRRTRRRSAPTR
ncbi:hypothetical protein GCM10029964_072900 [Kibdelosporangium lantanae]